MQAFNCRKLVVYLSLVCSTVISPLWPIDAISNMITDNYHFNALSTRQLGNIVHGGNTSNLILYVALQSWHHFSYMMELKTVKSYSS